MFMPINLNLEGRCCLIVGGGAVALRKCLTLLEFGARVKVVSPELKPKEDWPVDRIDFIGREFRKEDVDAATFLVIAATDSGKVNKEVVEIARDRGILVQRADAGDDSDFAFPAILRRGKLTVSVATGGVIPALTRKLKEKLQDVVGSEYEEFCTLVSDLRAEAWGRLSTERRKEFFLALADSDILHLLAGGNKQAAREKARSILEQYVANEG